MLLHSLPACAKSNKEEAKAAFLAAKGLSNDPALAASVDEEIAKLNK